MVADYDPRVGMAWARLRRAPGRPDRTPYLPAQALSAEQTLRGYTTEAAKVVGDVTGRLRAGLPADITAFAADPVEIDPDELPDVPVRLTVVGGEVVHDSLAESPVRRDPYRVLGVPPTASAEELHDAYRRLIKLHHPDRNGGSAESTARFQEIQAAYEELKAARARRPRRARPASPSRSAWPSSRARSAPRRPSARRRARRPVRRSGISSRSPSREPVEEEDSIWAILFDIIDEIGERITGPRRDPDVNDLIDGLDDLSSRLDGKP